MNNTTTPSAIRTTHNGRPTGRLPAWRTVDLITAVMIGVAFGVSFIGWGAVHNLFSVVFTALPPLSGLLGGFWWMPAVVAMLVIRRPGAAILAEVVAASVEPLLGGQWGIATLGSGLLQGLGVELGLLIFAYKVWTWLPAALGGALAGLLETPYERVLYYPEWDFSYIALYGVAMVVSGALLAGVVGWLLVRGLARTGALAPFPPGREYVEAGRRHAQSGQD